MRTWMKRKYSALKPKGKYANSHSDSAKKEKKVGGRLGRQAEPTHQRVLIIDGATGTRRWIWRPLD